MRSHTGLLVLILLVAAIGRCVFAGNVVGWDTPGKGDDAEFHVLATHLAAGDGFIGNGNVPTARRAPLYPAIIALVYRVTGSNEAVGRAVQVLLGVLVVWLLYAIGRRYFDASVALAGAGLVALNPLLIFVSGYMLSENLYLLLFLGALYLLPAPEYASRHRTVLLAAAVLALAAMTRPTALAIGVWMLCGAVLLCAAARRHRVITALLAVAVFSAITLPWSARNARLLGGWVGLSSFSGVVLLQGNNAKVVDIAHYRGGVAPLGALPDADRLFRLGELEQDREAARMAREFIKENWRKLPRMAWWKCKRFWRLRSDMGLSGIRSGWWFDPDTTLGKLAVNFDPGLIYSLVVFPLCAAGLWMTRRRWRELVFLYGVIVVHTAMAVVYFGSLRMRVPVEPVLALFAALAAVSLLRRLRIRLRSEPHGQSPAATGTH